MYYVTPQIGINRHNMLTLVRVNRFDKNSIHHIFYL